MNELTETCKKFVSAPTLPFVAPELFLGYFYEIKAGLRLLKDEAILTHNEKIAQQKK
jgi:hypothetical protein